MQPGFKAGKEAELDRFVGVFSIPRSMLEAEGRVEVVEADTWDDAMEQLRM